MSENKQEEIDKKKIYAEEKKVFVDWIKAVCEKSLDEVKQLADKYVSAGSVSSLNSLFNELSDAEGHKTIHFAVSRNHLDTVNWILDNEPNCINCLDHNGFSPLVHACIGDFVEMGELLIKRGAHMDPTEGCPPAVQCASSGSMHLLEYLVDHGVDINRMNPLTKETPLLAACANNQEAVVDYLLSHNATIDCVGDHQVTPLLLACLMSNTKLMECLLQHKANPLVVMEGNVSLLHIACSTGHIESVKLLLQYPEIQALANKKTDAGLLPIAEAVQAKSQAIVELLLPLTDEEKDSSVDAVMTKYAVKEVKKDDAAKSEDSDILAASKNAMDAEVVHHKKVEGVKLFNRGKYQEAIDVFNSALQLAPQDEILYSNRSSCYLHLKQYDKAMEDAERCIILKPKWAKGYYRKGMVFFEQQNYIDAGTSFYQGCEIAPADSKLANMFRETVELGKRYFAEHPVPQDDSDSDD